MENLFRMSIFDGAIELESFRQNNPAFSYAEAVEYLRKGPVSKASLDYGRALILGEVLKWDLPFEKTRQQVLMQMIKCLIFVAKPIWACYSHFGINKAISLMDLDELQLLSNAGLINKPFTMDALEWWDDIAKFSRGLEEDRNLSIGREGELRTLEHEKVRLRDQNIEREPEWVACFDNKAHFDVLSFMWVESNVHELYIEVKAYVFGPPHFFITRPEWEKALEHKSNYIFHIWNLDTNELLVMTVSNVLKHIPVNQGKGSWEKVEIWLDTIEE